MKKLFLSLAILITLVQTSKATVVVENVYKKVYADSATYELTFGPLSVSVLTFNYFAVPGSLAITGKTYTEFNSSLLADPIGGVNFHPTLIYNNENTAGMSNFNRNNIFLYNNNLTFTNKFAGKGNNYVYGRALFPATSDTMYFWVLINLNAAGTELNIIKVGYEDELNTRALTGTEGQNKPTTGLAEMAMPQLNVYPQPARETLHIEVSQQNIQAIQLYTIKGELVYQSAHVNRDIDISGLPAGIYLLRVETDAAALSRRVLIQ